MNPAFKWQPEDALDPEFVARLLGNPIVTVTNARSNAEALENERTEYTKSREKRLCELLQLCLSHVKEARQGRGDPALERLVMEELNRG